MTAIAINAFIHQGRKKLQQIQNSSKLENLGKFLMVMGNEASDCDSIVSSICYAYHLSTTTKTNQRFTTILPVISIPRNEFNLRCETKSLFNYLQIDTSALTFADDPELVKAFDKLPSEGMLQLVLTDHNELRGSLKELVGCVVEVLDHHLDCKVDYPNIEQKNIAFDSTAADGGSALVGSCCTLVAEAIIESERIISQSEATMLLSAISLDTVNFEPAAGKVTPRDEAAEKYLSKHSSICNPELFHWLQSEKFDPKNWNSFTIRNCLRYDYKQFVLGRWKFGVSSVLITLEELLSKELGVKNHEVLFNNYCAELSLDFLVIMSNSKSSSRELLLFADKYNSKVIQKAIEDIQCLELKGIESAFLPKSCTSIQLYKQNNGKVSRKKFIPLLQASLQSRKDGE